MPPNDRQVIVRMPKSVHAQAEAEAEAQGVTVSEIVRRAVAWYLSDEGEP